MIARRDQGISGFVKCDSVRIETGGKVSPRSCGTKLDDAAGKVTDIKIAGGTGQELGAGEKDYCGNETAGKVFDCIHGIPARLLDIDIL